VTISHLSVGGEPVSRSGENGKFSKMKNHVRGGASFLDIL